MKKAKEAEGKLTETELELMNILWSKNEGTVNDVMESLPKDRDLAYTSVSTILRILEGKGVLKTRKEGRGHVYIPLLKKSEFESKSVQHMVDKVFQGTPVALVRQLLDSVDLTADDLKELKAMISKAEKA